MESKNFKDPLPASVSGLFWGRRSDPVQPRPQRPDLDPVALELHEPLLKSGVLVLKAGDRFLLLGYL